MRGIRRCLSLLLALIACALTLTGCGEEKTVFSLSVCLGEAPGTLDPIRASTAAEQTVIGELYENLMRLDTEVSGETTVTKALAKSVDTETNYDGTVTYTFRLRASKWSDGESVTADDFVYAWQRLADPVSKAPNASLLCTVVGYEEVRASGDVSKLKVTAKSDSVLQVTLKGVCPWFLTDVCTAAATVPLRKDVVKELKAAAQEKNEQTAAAGGTGTLTWCSDPTVLVTNGPYRASETGDSGMTLTANARSHLTGAGPDTIRIVYAAGPEEAWKLYEAGTVDFVARLPELQMQERAKLEGWTAQPELSVTALLFNSAAEPFSDPLVRKALSMSADRTALSALTGTGASPATGLVPVGVPGIDGEDFRTAGGTLVDCDPENYPEWCAKAKAMLSQAGFESGRSFPALTLYYSDSDDGRIAQTLAEVWYSVLHIRVQTEAVSEQKLQSLLKSGEYTLACQTLRGRSNDAESFLSAWKSNSEDNAVRYYNSAYDTLLTVIDGASDETGRLGCLHDAESLLLDDCPLTPLYFTATAWELRDTFTGLCRDARGWFSFTNVKPADQG